MNDLWDRPLEAPPRREWTHEEKLELFQLKREGHSLMALARRYGVPPYEIRDVLQEIGAEIVDALPSNGKRWREGNRYGFGSFSRRYYARSRPLENFFNDVFLL